MADPGGGGNGEISPACKNSHKKWVSEKIYVGLYFVFNGLFLTAEGSRSATDLWTIACQTVSKTFPLGMKRLYYRAKAKVTTRER